MCSKVYTEQNNFLQNGALRGLNCFDKIYKNKISSCVNCVINLKIEYLESPGIYNFEDLQSTSVSYPVLTKKYLF